MTSLLHYALKMAIEPFIPKFTLDSLTYALRSGAFVLILDGLDEVNFDRRDQYITELTYLARRWPHLKIVISTRPDDSLAFSDMFSTFHVAPMPKVSAIKLITNIRYDEIVKAKFVKALDEKLYDSHKDFASNPLLLTLMLLTYGQVGDLPTKMHIFYNQAFETLVLKHDISKSMYTRKTHSDLDLEQVRQLFSYFCAISYFRQQYSFSEHDCDALLSEALDAFEIECDVKSAKLDLIVSFSMLQRDGLFITFVHRLFQEYFAAVYLATDEVDSFFEITLDLVSRGSSETCALLLSEIAQPKFDNDFLGRFFSEHLIDIRALAKQNDVAGFASKFFHGIAPRLGKGVQVGPSSETRKRLQSVARILESRLGLCAYSVATARNYNDEPKVIEQAEKFFGSLSQFDDVWIQPAPEDNLWLAGTKLSEEMVEVGEFVDAVEQLLERRDARRKARKGKLQFKRVDQVEASQIGKQFVARVEEDRIDEKTGKKKKVLVNRGIIRRVVE